MSPRYSIGIDLGTTNSALAFVPLAGDGQTRVLPVRQWESLSLVGEAPILPSFLYLPEESAARQLAGRDTGPGEWVVGRLARSMAGENPGRVVHSAKSWLCHPGADPSAPFLPWGSQDIRADRKISPIRASALILNALRGGWDSQFVSDGADSVFDAQEITITVPASFDPAAQRLTRDAAAEAGYPPSVRLLEEPQAAFYAWLADHDAVDALRQSLAGAEGATRHILVVDVGGGTSDFSLFALRDSRAGALPTLRRVAVSEHILLGGDNIDLAIAHRLERQLVDIGGKLSGAQWDYLVARCRELKERALAEESATDAVFSVAVPGRGSGLVAGTISARISRAEVEDVLFEGFFPFCAATDQPRKAKTALREWGLAFAADSAVTRHLAAFLAGRPRVDAVLFNGGSLAPPRLRERLCSQITQWQDGAAPSILDNARPDLAVARGAARFGELVHRSGERIEAGAAHSVFLALHRRASPDGSAAPPLVCVLPHGAAAEETFAVRDLALALRVNRPVRFQTFTSTRHERIGAGTLLAWNGRDFRPLPPLETVARLDRGRGGKDGERSLPVELTATLSELGLLQLSLHSTDPEVRQSWPLDFNLRALEVGDALLASEEGALPVAPNVAPGALEAARQRLQKLFAPVAGRAAATRVSGARAFKELEAVIGLPKADWNWAAVRALWPTLEDCLPRRAISVEHEETWLILAGFVLRPGFGAPLDAVRMDALWQLADAGLCFPGKRNRSQLHILWRRVAGGLTRDRQERLLAGEIAAIRRRTDVPAELIHLLGSLERISQEAKAELIALFIEAALRRSEQRQHATPYFAALGHLLNRAPLYAGPETVVPPDRVEEAFAAFAAFDWRDPAFSELVTLFLRAARVVDNRSLDLPRSVRQRIAGKLEKSGVSPLRAAKVRDYMPLERSERLGLYGEALPPGLLLDDSEPAATGR
jgi:molecular chaperone DnaK (HSP70)